MIVVIEAPGMYFSGSNEKTFARAEYYATKRTTISYVGESDNIAEKITQKRTKTNVLVNYEKTNYTYYENGDVNTAKTYGWVDSEWKIELEEQYNSDGNIVLSDEFTYGENVSEEKTTYTYDENGQLTEQIIKTRTGDAELTNSKKRTYSYNSAGDVLITNVSQWLLNDWHQTYREEYRYDGFGNNTKVIITNYTNTINIGEGVVETTHKSTVTDFEYDIWNQLVKTIENSGETDEYIVTVLYDNLGRTTSVTEDGKTIPSITKESDLPTAFPAIITFMLCLSEAVRSSTLKKTAPSRRSR